MTDAVEAGTPEALRRLFVAWLEDRAREAEALSCRHPHVERILRAEGEAAAYREAADHWRAVRIEGAGDPDREMRMPGAKVRLGTNGLWHWAQRNLYGETLGGGFGFVAEADARADAEANGYEVVA